MALLVCPDCGGNVSSKAAKCPRCGCPVSVMIQEQQNSENQQNTKQQSVEQSIQEQSQPVEIVKNEEKNIEEQQNSENQQNTEQQSVEQSIQEQPQPVEIVNNEEKIIEEQPKVSVQKEEKVVEPSIRQKSAKEKTNNIIVAVAIIILFGIIIVAGKMSGNNERESSYVPSDNTNSETASAYNQNVAKIQNPEEATQRLNDFKRKITSSPFEKDAIEIIKVIDNGETKGFFFVGNISEIEDAIGGSKMEETLFFYEAKSDKLYELNNSKFIECSFSHLNTQREYVGEEYYDVQKNKSRTYQFSIYELPNQHFYIELHYYYRSNLIDLSLTDFYTKVIECAEIYKSKYLIMYENDANYYMDDRTYTVKDLLTGEDIQNPFIKIGKICFYGSGSTSIDLTVEKNAAVSGRLVYEGKIYDVIGSESIYQKIILHPTTRTDDYNDYYFTITPKENKYILEKGYPDCEAYEVESSMEVFKK